MRTRKTTGQVQNVKCIRLIISSGSARLKLPALREFTLALPSQAEYDTDVRNTYDAKDDATCTVQGSFHNNIFLVLRATLISY